MSEFNSSDITNKPQNESPESIASIDTSNVDLSNEISLVGLSLDDNDLGTSESTSNKLARSSEVLFGGILDGTLDSAGKAIRDPMTLLKLGGSVGAGALLTVMSAKRGKFRIAAHGLGIGLGGVFAKDVYDHGSQAKSILSETWNNPYSLDRNRAEMATTLGPFLTDAAIYTAGGLGGVKLGHKAPSFQSVKERVGGIQERFGRKSSEPELVEFPLFDLGHSGKPQNVRIPKDAPLGHAVSKYKNSVGKAEVLTYKNGELSGGSATAVSISRDGKLATNKHLVDDAFNVTVFDAKGRAHDAHVIAHGPDWRMDLAILQLDNPRSFKAFEPARGIGKTPDALSEGTQIAFLGHTEGLNTMHVSRGSYGKQARGKADVITCNANVSSGNCGSALIDMDGTLLGIMRGDLGNSARNVVSVPAKHIPRLLAEKPKVMENTVREGRVLTDGVAKPKVTEYAVDNPQLAKSNLDDIFSMSLDRGLADDFFHLRARRTQIQTEAGPKELTLSTRFEPLTREVTVKPSALDGRAIGKSEVWPGTDIPMTASELKLTFGKGYETANLRSVNDPTGTLVRGLEFKQSQPSYLSTLEPLRTASPAPTTKLNLNFDYLFGASLTGVRGLTGQSSR